MTPWFQNIIDALLPPQCLLCGKILQGRNGLCEDCFSKISFISAPLCRKCGHPLPHGTSVLSCPNCVNDNKNPFQMQRSMVYYDDGSRPLITNFKFHDRTENASFLAGWLYTAGHDIWQNGVDVLIPVPLHQARLHHRKFNQSALLCKELSKLTKIPTDYTSLIRCKNTKPQVECNGNARRHNIKGAFQVTKQNKIEGKRIVLVDDVMTTGSTLRECGEVLLKAGALSVDALTVARVIKA